jgi:hypothetical protein
MRRLLILFLLWGLGACADVPLASAELDAAGKRFDPPAAGYGALYVIRDGGLTSSATQVSLNARKIGTLGSDTWLRIDVQPGTYVVRGDAGNVHAATTIIISAGEYRYVTFSTNVMDLTFGGNFFSLLVAEQPEGSARPSILKKKRALSGT